MALSIDGRHCARPGRTLGTTLYAQWGPEPVTGDAYLAIFDSRALAHGVAATLNGEAVGDCRLVAIGRLLYLRAQLSSGPVGLDDAVGWAVSAEVARYLAHQTGRSS